MPINNPNPFPLEMRPKRILAFWSKVKIGDPKDCWEWISYRNKAGYGLFQCGGKNAFITSRLAFRIAYGGDPLWARVLHRCDNPPCCNPDHLFLGDDSDNAKDASSKRRMSHGESHRSSKLSDDDVREIRRSYRYNVAGFGMQSLAKRYGVTPSTVYFLLKRVTWRHIE